MGLLSEYAMMTLFGGELPPFIKKMEWGTIRTENEGEFFQIEHHLGELPKGFMLWADGYDETNLVPSSENYNHRLNAMKMNIGQVYIATGNDVSSRCIYVNKNGTRGVANDNSYNGMVVLGHLRLVRFCVSYNQ